VLFNTRLGDPIQGLSRASSTGSLFECSCFAHASGFRPAIEYEVKRLLCKKSPLRRAERQRGSSV